MVGARNLVLLLLLFQQSNLQFELVRELQIRKRRKRPRFWVRPWLAASRRLTHGHYHRLMRELRLEDTASFINFMRMEP